MIVLPLDETRNLICKLRVRLITSRLIHGTLVTSLQTGCFQVIPQTASLIASLVLKFASHNVENESVTGNLLTWLDLDNIARLDAAPVTQLKTFVPFWEYEFLDWLTVHFFSCLLEFSIMHQIEAARRYDASNCDKDHVRIVSGNSLAWNGLRAEMYH